MLLAYRELFDASAWVLFVVLGTVLWVAGVRLFLAAPLSRQKKIGWPLLLVVLGIGIGSMLPLWSIRNKCLLLMGTLPLLAAIDIKLARSNRSFLFWFRACAFEICTVFGSAAIARVILSSLSHS